MSISSKDLDADNVRIDILDENIEDINRILDVVYNRERLEGPEFTSGNYNREV